MARKFGNVFRGGRTRRVTAWVEVVATQTSIIGASTAVLVNVANATLLDQRPFTVIRVRGAFHMRSDQAAASEDWGCSIGWCTAEDAAVAIGVTAVPTPITDLGSDSFFAYESLFGRFQFGTAVGVEEIGAFRTYDSKGMRKCEDDGTSPILTMETSAVSSSAVVVHQARLLIKLH